MSPRANETGPEIDFSSRVREHLAGWGLRSFSSEAAYYAWQQQALTSEQLQLLTDLAKRRQGEDGPKWDQAFYDLAAHPDILPVLYSQRFGYYEQVGVAIAQRLLAFSSHVSILDVGCGVGILTTWYASVFPHLQFRGIDRSPQSIVAAKQYAAGLQLPNVDFSCVTVSPDVAPGQYDGIIATQALFQSEVDPGIPSQSWRSFERAQDLSLLLAAEERTGLGTRLDGLLKNLKPHTILLLLEKTLHLGRRVLFQRALMRRGFGQRQQAKYLHYHNLGELETEGPLYVVSREQPWVVEWDESPHTTPGDGLYRSRDQAARFIYSRVTPGQEQELWSARIHGRSLSGVVSTIAGGLTLGCLKEGPSVLGVIVGGAADGMAIQHLLINLRDQVPQSDSIDQLCAHLVPTHVDAGPVELLPMYENHTSVAQRVWADLAGRQVTRSETSEAPGGKARYIELGTCLGEWVYVYWANTYDQRQLVMMDAARKSLLEEYFEESVRQPC